MLQRASNLRHEQWRSCNSTLARIKSFSGGRTCHVQGANRVFWGWEATYWENDQKKCPAMQICYSRILNKEWIQAIQCERAIKLQGIVSMSLKPRFRQHSWRQHLSVRFWETTHEIWRILQCSQGHFVEAAASFRESSPETEVRLPCSHTFVTNLVLKDWNLFWVVESLVHCTKTWK